MARNKRNESGFRPARAFTALVLFVLFVTLGVGYDWFQGQRSDLGSQNKKLEDRLDALKKENRDRRVRLADWYSPVKLDAQVKKLNLGLGPPALAQVIRMTDLPPDSPAAPLDLPRPEPVALARNN
jgi:hypothetical protein